MLLRPARLPSAILVLVSDAGIHPPARARTWGAILRTLLRPPSACPSANSVRSPSEVSVRPASACPSPLSPPGPTATGYGDSHHLVAMNGVSSRPGPGELFTCDPESSCRGMKVPLHLSYLAGRPPSSSRPPGCFCAVLAGPSSGSSTSAAAGPQPARRSGLLSPRPGPWSEAPEAVRVRPEPPTCRATVILGTVRKGASTLCSGVCQRSCKMGMRYVIP